MAGVRMVAASAMLCAIVHASSAAAQHEGPPAADHFAMVSANALLGAVGAGVAAWARGEDVARAFLLGAGGGSLSYAGKVTATQGFAGAPVLGRQLAAVGHGMIGNAGAGRAALSELWLPLTPFRVRLPLPGAGWRLQLDLAESTALLYGVLTPELEFDPWLALHYGTPVFVARGYHLRVGDDYVGGLAAIGSIFLAHERDVERRRSILAHEMVHVIQHDFAKVALSYPVEDWVLERLLPGSAATSPLKGGFLASGLDLLLGGLRSEGFVRELVEREAASLVRPARPRPGPDPGT